jgi:hypothetical protein
MSVEERSFHLNKKYKGDEILLDNEKNCIKYRGLVW